VPDEFEARAAERVRELGSDIDLGSFAASFDLFRLATRTIGDFDTAVHRPLGLSMAGFRVLFTVWVFGSLEVRDIARLSGVSRAAVSGVVTTLERDGLALRQRDQADGRLVSVTVTDDGVEKLRTAYREQHRREQLLFAGLDPSELATFTATLRKLLRVRPGAEGMDR
jgi:DNA-binding MarR family transcriptional regulator